jgi:BNR-Asp box repeat
MRPSKILLLLAAVWCGLNSASAQTWTQATNAPYQDWSGIASSSDGIKLVAVTYSQSTGFAGVDGMYASTNSGATWTHLTNIPNVYWGSVACSADGNVIVGGGAYDLIYTSTNSGISWMSNNVPNYWVSVAASGDGSKLAAVDFYDTLIYTSTNSGVSWTSNAIPNSNNASSFGLARAVCCSADGTSLVVATLGGTIFTSTNFGLDWKASDAPITNWTSMASSADGSKLVAACAEGGIYTSIDSGANWILQTNAPNENWYSIASSVDGSKLVAVAGGDVLGGGEPEPIYTSSDFGATWTSNNAPDTFWYCATSSADGCKIAAVVNGGGIYTSYSAPSPQMNITPTNGNLKLSWIVPSTNFVMQQSSDLSSWMDVTVTPMLNFTNLQEEVVLSPTNSSGFYRLKSY